MSGDPISYPTCTCPQGGWFSVSLPPPCAVHSPQPYAPGPGVFDVASVTAWRPTDPQPSTVVLSDAEERIARRVAELLRGAP